MCHGTVMIAVRHGAGHIAMCRGAAILCAIGIAAVYCRWPLQSRGQHCRLHTKQEVSPGGPGRTAG